MIEQNPANSNESTRAVDGSWTYHPEDLSRAIEYGAHEQELDKLRLHHGDTVTNLEQQHAIELAALGES